MKQFWITVTSDTHIVIGCNIKATSKKNALEKLFERIDTQDAIECGILSKVAVNTNDICLNDSYYINKKNCSCVNIESEDNENTILFDSKSNMLACYNVATCLCLLNK